MRWPLLLLVLPLACAEPPPSRSAPRSLRADVALALTPTQAPWPETDALPLHTVTRAGAPWLGDVAGATVLERFVYAVDGAGVLWKVGADRRIRLLDGVLAVPVPGPEGPLVTVRGAEPGASAVWVLADEGPPRPLLEAAELPCALPDGKLAFVSTRTSVASVWLHAADSAPVQLTNVGLAAGRGLAGFVPPPARWLSCTDEALTWDDGRGAAWRLDLASGVAREVAR